ncbi:serine hydrolase domain-containing protein [Streptomyces sp. NPDC086091]|uniref:serine hydrolase domain-containing protein n=1 Tax=Streptomyces sp. NPDC086091 TaxID=3365751 RepID=UPI0037F4D3AC
MSGDQVSGHCDPRFTPVRDTLADLVDSGEDLGASIAVDVDGETVVDLWGGWHDTERRTPWTRDTLVNVWSTTKTVTALAALVLVERGLLDPYAPVARYWPEFAAGGKEAVEVRHVLSHTSGVSGWDAPFTTEQMYDLPAATAALAAQKPWWEPGTASGYHAQTMGHLVGELVRRVTGLSLTEFVARELAGPLGADFRIGAAVSDTHRIAPVIVPPPLPIDFGALDPDSPVYKTFAGPRTDPAAANTPAWRAAELGALNGHGNARSVTRLLRVLALGGTADGVRLLSPETVDLVFDEQSHGVDLVLGVPVRFGIGFALPETRTVPYIPSGRVCYWGGWGGSLAVADLDRRVTVSYMMNKMGAGIIGSPRAERYLRAVYAALGEEGATGTATDA